MKGISKEFSGNKVLNDINFKLYPGEILGLVGENGAGKSTLMKILFGMDEIRDTGGYGGDVLIDGQKVKFNSSEDAIRQGIGMVHQEFSLIPDFTVGENILLNREPEKYSVMSELFGKRLNTLDRKEMQRRALKAIERLGVELDANRKISGLPVGYKQFTEIARELSKEDDEKVEGAKGIRLLVLDEPTAVLSEHEAVALLKAMRMLSDAGISIIFISHRLQEIIDLCDKLIVLRDGRVIQEAKTSETNVRQIAAWMVDRKGDGGVQTEERKEEHQKEIGEVVLKTEHLWVDMPGETVRDVSIEVRRGEILGFGGLAGQGKVGISNGIMGLYAAGGKVWLRGKEIKLNDPDASLREGMAFVSEDRRGVGLLLEEGIDWNITFTAMQVQEKFIKNLFGGLVKWRDDKAIEQCAEDYIKSLEIRCTGPKQRAIELSGGNQQKVCLAKAFAVNPEILFVSEPTRGIDVGAKKLVLDTLRRVNRENGTTIIMTSSELEELRSICDRIAIINEGRVSGILPASAEAEEFGLLMLGHVEEQTAAANQ